VARARLEAAEAGKGVPGQIASLRNRADAELNFAKNANSQSTLTLDRQAAEIRGIQLNAQAEQKLQNLREENRKSVIALTVAQDQENIALESKRETVQSLTKLVADLEAKRPLQYMTPTAGVAGATLTMTKRTLTPEEIKLDTELVKQQTAAQLRLNSAIKANGEMARELGNALAQGFGKAILSGENLRDTLHALLGDLLQIIMQRTILGPLADVITGGLLKIPGIGGSAAGGPISGPRVVGEYGPELLIPSSSATIIPNEQLRGGGKAGNNYYIDARGADQTAVNRLESMLLTLAGPGVVERRSLSATINAKRRGGAAGLAIA
jgi:hypothetical protein